MKSGNALPPLSQTDVRDCHRANAELSGQFPSSFVIEQSRAYFFNLFFSQLRHQMLFARALSSLHHFVSHIIFVSSEKKMLWIYTKRVIAFVKHEFSDWNRTSGNNPRKTVRIRRNLIPVIEPSVAISPYWPSPVPALSDSTFPDASPEFC